MNDAPDIDQMFTALKKRAELRGRIKVLDLDIKAIEIPVKKQSPRKPELRDEASMDLQREKVNLECELEQVEATIEYLNFYAAIWKSNQYNVGRQL